ncbi:MAG: AAA family ATPase, partial [Armatimonadetes bacterium]|nr:AAA family ATPase [Armatimonadota bacterium]
MDPRRRPDPLRPHEPAQGQLLSAVPVGELPPHPTLSPGGRGGKGIPLEIPEAVVERITFHNPENGFTIARVGVPGQRDHLTIVGYFTEIAPGEVLALQGEWTEHPRHGPQFKVSSHATRKPSTLVGIERYLGSGLIKGIGPVTARRIVERFGTETLDIIDADVRRLLEVPGLGPGRLDYVRKAWEEQRAIRDVMVFLKEHGVSTAYAVKIYKTYGDQAVRLVSEDPYRLAKDIWGVGFVTADRIARSIGIPLDAERRLGAGLRHVLGEAGDDGHCYLPRAELIARAAEVLEVPAERVEEVLGGLASSGDVIADPLRTDAGAVSDPGTPVYHPALYHAERGVAQCLRALLAAPAEVDPSRVSTWIDRYAAHTGVQLSPEQREAVMLGAASRVLVITGGPGTGKTTTVRTLVKLFQAMGKRIALCSPTGRAAQRLEEVTGTPAATIHRLLEWSPAEQGFTRHQGRPLEADVVITDEVSMLDISLAHNLLRAVLDTAQAILVGDVDQLPSVGPGNVLRDLIASGTIPVVRFRQVFRQAAASAIITNA